MLTAPLATACHGEGASRVPEHGRVLVVHLGRPLGCNADARFSPQGSAPRYFAAGCLRRSPRPPTWWSSCARSLRAVRVQTRRRPRSRQRGDVHGRPSPRSRGRKRCHGARTVVLYRPVGSEPSLADDRASRHRRGPCCRRTARAGTGRMTAVSQENVDLAKESLEAFRRGDIG